MFNALVKAAIGRRAFAHAARAVGATKGQLAGLLSSAVEEGKGVPELARDIRRTFEFNSKVRSLRIARTELTEVINDGAARTLDHEGYPEKQWSTVIDGRERPTHAQADGQSVPADGYFAVGGNACRYPGDETLPPGERVNCRCTVVGSGVPESRARRQGEMFLKAHGSLERQFQVSLRRAFLDQRNRILSRLP